MKFRLDTPKIVLAVILCFFFQNQISAADKFTKPNEPGPWPEIQVNTYTGNLFYKRSDLFIPTRGEIPLEITFSYNSLKHQHDKGYGNGWTFSFGMYYKPVGNDIVIFREEGQEDIFIWDEAIETFNPPVGVYEELTEYEADKFLLRTKYGIKYYFENESHKQLTKIVDRNGNTTTISYTGGKPTRITDPSGRLLNLGWVGDHLSQITDPNTTPGRVIAFTYDGSWNLIQVTRPLANTWQYGYDVNGNMTSINDPRSNTVTISYDVNEAVAGLSCAPVNYNKTFTYNNCNNTTTVSQVVSAVNRQTIYTFDLNGKVTGIQHPDGSLISLQWDSQDNLIAYVNEVGSATNYTYDSKGNMLSETDCLNNTSYFTYENVFNKVTSYQDKRGSFSTNTYDVNGNLASVTDCYNKAEVYTYNSFGEMISSTDKNNQVTTYSYDLFGNQIGVTDPLSFSETKTYDQVGNMLTVTDKRSFITTFNYDLLNRVTLKTDAMGYTRSFNYDANGNLTVETNENGNTTTHSYDALNRMTVTINPLGGTFSKTYDEAGNVVNETNARGFTTLYTFNSRDWLLSITDCQGNTSSRSYNPAGKLLTSSDKGGNTTTYSYNCLGHRIGLIDPNGFNESFAYDAESNMTAYINKNGIPTSYVYNCLNLLTTINDALGFSESFTYDPVGIRTAHTDKNGNTTIYSPDAISRITAVTDPLGKTEFKTYDGQCNVTSSTDKKGNTTIYSYDPLGRLILKTDPPPFGYTESFIYDGVGNMLSSTDRNGNSTVYEYDFLNRQTKATTPMGYPEFSSYDANGNLASFTSKNGYTTTFNYNCLDQVTATIDPLSFTETNTYNANGQRTGYTDKKGQTTSWAYSCCQLINETDPLLFTEYYGYDNTGNRTSVTNKNGNTTTYYYDGLNRLYKISTPMGNQTLYTLDGNGNILTNKDANLQTIIYTYNDRGELINKLYPDATQINYNYDDNGNLLQTVNTGGIDETITYIYDELGRVTSKSTNYGSFTKTIAYAYDNNGNTVTITSETGTITHAYDEDNRLIQTTDQNGGVTTFQYDGMGNQTVVNYPNGVSTFTSYDPNGNVISVVTQTIPPPPLVMNAGMEGAAIKIDPGREILDGIDYAVIEIASPVSGTGLGEEVPVMITVMNMGTVMLPDFVVSYTLDDTIAVTEFVTMPIPPLGFYVHIFSQTVDLSIPGNTYELTACVDAYGDVDPSNNCMTTSIINIILVTTYQSFNYEFDPNGNNIMESHLEGTFIELDYNDRNELISEFNTATGKLNEYTYTPAGQRETMTVNGILANLNQYNLDGTLLSSGDATFTSDYNGNRTSMTTADGDVTNYSYSFDNELIQVSVPGLSTAQYDYSALGDQLRQIEDGIITYSHYTGGQLLNEFDGLGSPTYYYNPDISIMGESFIGYNYGAGENPYYSRNPDRSLMSGTLTAYYYYDGKGSTTLQLDSNKVELARTACDAFGNTTISTGSWLNSRRAFTDLNYRPNLSLYSSKSGNFLGNSEYDPLVDNPLNASLLGGFNDPLMWKWYTLWLKTNKGLVKGGIMPAPGGGRPHGGRPGAGWLGPIGKWPVGGGPAAVMAWRRGVAAAALFGFPPPAVAFAGGIPIFIPPRAAPFFPGPAGLPLAGFPGGIRWLGGAVPGIGFPGILAGGAGGGGGGGGALVGPPNPPVQRPSGGGGIPATGSQGSGTTICGGSGGGLGGVGVISSGTFRTPANFTVRQGMIMDCSRISWSIMKMPNGSFNLQISGQNGAIPRDRNNVNNTPPYMSVRVEIAWTGFWAINNTNSQGAFSGNRDINCRDPFFMKLQYFSPWGGQPTYWGPCEVP